MLFARIPSERAWILIRIHLDPHGCKNIRCQNSKQKGLDPDSDPFGSAWIHMVVKHDVPEFQAKGLDPDLVPLGSI